MNSAWQESSPDISNTAEPCTTADGNHLANVGENTGIAVAVGVQHATDLIDANQIGFELPTG